MGRLRGLSAPFQMRTSCAFFQRGRKGRPYKQSLNTLSKDRGLAVTYRFNTSLGIPDGPGDFPDLLAALNNSSAVNGGIPLEKTRVSWERLKSSNMSMTAGEGASSQFVGGATERGSRLSRPLCLSNTHPGCGS